MISIITGTLHATPDIRAMQRCVGCADSEDSGADNVSAVVIGDNQSVCPQMYPLCEIPEDSQATAAAWARQDFLREILDNLIENAIKYTPSGGAIWCNVRGDGDRVLINVTDTGMGIAPDDLKHVFQKFYRADNSQTRTIGGTGLGLYIVKQRTEAMGGRVWAESSFGEGSTFYVSLPRLTPDEYIKQRQVMANVANMQLTPAPAASGQMGQTAMMAAIAAPQSALAPTAIPQPAPAPTNEAPVQAPTNLAPAPQPAPAATPVATTPTSEAPAAAPTQASDMTPEKLAEMKAKFAAQAQAAGSGNG